jgi:predicted kinase
MAVAKNPQRVIALCGPPAVGKSTFANQLKERLGDDCVIVSPDAFLWENGIYKFTPARVKEAWHLAYSRLEKCSLKTNTPFIVFDATLTSPSARKSFLGACGMHVRAGASLEVVTFENPGLETLLERNSERTPDRQVPDDTIRSMYTAWISAPIQRSEGWNVVWSNGSKLIEDLEQNYLAPKKAEYEKRKYRGEPFLAD